MNDSLGIFSVLMVVLPTIIAGLAGYVIRGYEKKKDREFELAKIKSKIYEKIIISLRPALFSDTLDNKKLEEVEEGYNSWQNLLTKFDMIWLYGSYDSIEAFKELMSSYGDGNTVLYYKYLVSFIHAARSDVLKLYGQSSSSKVEYKFLTFNLNESDFSDKFNRLSSWHNKSSKKDD